MSLHELHCWSCVAADCEQAGCRLQTCPRCAVPLHPCKLAEHLAEICPLAAIPCPLRQYGCQAELVRNRVALHYQQCPAFVLRCNFSWSRSFISLAAKRRFKLSVKGFLSPTPVEQLRPEDAELHLALRDQQAVAESLLCSRECRTRQRDCHNVLHPLLPLRFKSAAAQLLEADSSDEEEKAQMAALRSKRKTFAGCMQCQIDPSAQHLHTLGNLNPKVAPQRPTAGFASAASADQCVLPPFHAAHGLYMSPVSGRDVPSAMTGDRNQQRLVYNFVCAQSIRRFEYLDHAAYHDDLAHAEGGRTWFCTYGCGFNVAVRVCDVSDSLRFEAWLGAVTYSAPRRDPPQAGPPHLDALLHAVEQSAAWLSSKDLSSLAASCSALRRLLRTRPRQLMIIYPVWERSGPGGRWAIKELRSRFSRVQRREWHFQPNPDLNAAIERHWAECPLKVRRPEARPAHIRDDMERLGRELHSLAAERRPEPDDPTSE